MRMSTAFVDDPFQLTRNSCHGAAPVTLIEPQATEENDD
jgi:hypothetical protein